VQDSGANDGEVRAVAELGDYVERTIVVPYAIPAGTLTNPNLGVSVRFRNPDTDGPALGIEIGPEETGLVNQCFSRSAYDWSNAFLDTSIGPGEVTVRVEVTEECLSNGTPLESYIDVINVRDERFDYTFDNTTDANDQLSGPQLYPDLFAFNGINPTTTQRDIDFAEVSQTWDDISNQQFIEVASDSGFSDSIRADNAETVSGTLNTTREIYTRVGFSRYTTDSTTSPTSGDTGQAIDVHNLFANPQAITKADIGTANVRAIIPAGDAVNDTFAESGLFDSAGNLLTSGVIPEFQKQDGQLVISSERLRFEND